MFVGHHQFFSFFFTDGSVIQNSMQFSKEKFLHWICKFRNETSEDGT